MQIHFSFSRRVKEDLAFHRGSSLISVAEALPVDTLEEMCQTGMSECTAFPKLTTSCSPCNPAAASPPKDLLAPSTATQVLQHPYRLVLTASLHNETNTPGHSSGGSIRNRNRFLSRLIGLPSLQIHKRIVI